MKVGESIYMAPSAVPIDRVEADDLFVLRKDGTVSQSPANASAKAGALSHCSPLFMNAYKSESDLIDSNKIIAHDFHCIDLDRFMWVTSHLFFL